MKIEPAGAAGDDAAWASTLSPRELEVALLAASGFSNKELARKLGITEGTIKSHMHSILRKLGVDRRYSLIRSINSHSRTF